MWQYLRMLLYLGCLLSALARRHPSRPDRGRGCIAQLPARRYRNWYCILGTGLSEKLTHGSAGSLNYSVETRTFGVDS